MESLTLVKHLILKNGKRPIKIPLDKPFTSDILEAKNYVLKIIGKVTCFYNSIYLSKDKKENYSLSIKITYNERIYTFNIVNDNATVVYVCLNKNTNEETLLEWELNEQKKHLHL